MKYDTLLVLNISLCDIFIVWYDESPLNWLGHPLSHVDFKLFYLDLEQPVLYDY